MRAILRRIWLTLTARPGLRDVSELAFATCVFGVTVVTLFARLDFVTFVPRAPGEIAFIALRAFFIPTLGEELVFRAALIPGPDEGVKPALPIAISTFTFTLWHVAETAFLPNSAATFLRLDFLTLAALLGVACAILRWRSGSIWTAVALHWIVVVAWQGWFGGPSFGAAG